MTCTGCTSSLPGAYRCLSCFLGALLCKDCLGLRHANTPLHRVQVRRLAFITRRRYRHSLDVEWIVLQ